MTTPARATILIVDDQEELRDVMREGLVKHFTVVTANNGAEGLARYFDVRPDCVVIDVKMPELDGYQLTKALRGDPESARTPLVILTAMGQDRDRLAGLMSGVDLYLIKPVLPSELVEAIYQVLGISDEERERRLRALLDAPEETSPDA